MDTEIYQQLPRVLLPWYQENHRDLPWRQTAEPYPIWLSEIMLQQTRVEAVKGYYARFLAAVPDIPTLAQADDELLHKLWEGLGYYSRVRNLKKAAQQIMEQHAGIFPTAYADIRALPGIGDYTAGAISSIAFQQPRAAVDGNVMRIITRLTGDSTSIDLPAFKKAVRERLEAVYPAQAGMFTQALMELGATLCGPNRKPECGSCPCRSFCVSARQGNPEAFPVKSPKRQRRDEEKTVLIFSCEGRYALRKRTDTGLLAGLWEFPNVPGHLDPEAALNWAVQIGLHPVELLRQVQREHIFTHIRWDLRGIYIEVAQPAGDFTWLTVEQISNQAALPTAFRQFWEEIENV